MFNKPHDIIYVFVILALIIVTMGFGIQGAVDNLGAEDEGRISFFTQTQHKINDSNYFKGGVDSATSSLQPEEGAAEEQTDISIITSGFKSMLALGQTYKAVEATIGEGSKILGIDAIYWSAIMGAIIVTLFVVVYTWIRGKG